MKKNIKLMSAIVFSIVVSFIGTSQLASAATVQKMTVEDDKLVVKFDANYQVKNETTVKQYLNEIDAIKPFIDNLDETKITIESNVAENLIKVIVSPDVIKKGGQDIDGTKKDGLYRKIIFGKDNSEIRIQVEFERNKDGTWNYQSSKVTFLTKDAFATEKKREKDLDKINKLFEKAKQTKKTEDLEDAIKESDKLLGVYGTRYDKYWDAIIEEVRLAAKQQKPELKPEENKENIAKEKVEAKKQNSVSIKAPNTGVEKQNSSALLVLISIVLTLISGVVVARNKF